MPTTLRIKIQYYLGKTPITAPIHEILARMADYLDVLEQAEVSCPWNPDELPPGIHLVAVDTWDLSDQHCRSGSEFTPSKTGDDAPRVPAAVGTTIADEHLQGRRTCPLCGLLHPATDCTVYVTTKMRLRRVQRLKLCILCLREGLPAASCPRRTTNSCKICRHGQHSRALCMVAIDGRQCTVRHPSQMRATKDSIIDSEASDQQRHSRTSTPAGSSIRPAERTVNRDVTSNVPTATTLRQSRTQSSLGHIHGNMMNREETAKDLGTDHQGQPDTNRPPTT
ncbi:Zinc knuckle family protein [Aphelenchoides avenae]|nr:Zinc knuckle family protein [Aphelenchus avenae]